jgi:hypothetical protein
LDPFDIKEGAERVIEGFQRRLVDRVVHPSGVKGIALAHYQVCISQDSEMMGDEVGRQAELISQLTVALVAANDLIEKC